MSLMIVGRNKDVNLLRIHEEDLLIKKLGFNPYKASFLESKYPLYSSFNNVCNGRIDFWYSFDLVSSTHTYLSIQAYSNAKLNSISIYTKVLKVDSIANNVKLINNFLDEVLYSFQQAR